MCCNKENKKIEFIPFRQIMIFMGAILCIPFYPFIITWLFWGTNIKIKNDNSRK